MIEAITRYPVKSMAGESLQRAEISPDGLRGDREWAVHDVATGLVASAKHPARFGRLLSCSAALPDALAEAPIVSVAGGRPMACGDPALDARLSRLLERRVEVRRGAAAGDTLSRTDPPADGDVAPGRLAPARTGPIATGTPGAARLVDFAPIHLVTRATLDAVAVALPHGDADAARFRPNLVLALEALAFEETTWVGRSVLVGTAELEILLPTPRCVVPTLAQGGRGSSDHLLRTLARLHRPPVADRGPMTCLGVYARVVHPGHVSLGDPMRLGRPPSPG